MSYISFWYKKWIGRFIFRKLNMGIGISLIAIFVLLWAVTYNSFYAILENKEQELLNSRTEKLGLQFMDMIDKFKYDARSIHQDSSSELQTSIYELFLPNHVALLTDDRRALAEQNYLKSVMTLMLTRNPLATSVMMYRLQDQRLFFESPLHSYTLNRSFDYAGFFGTFSKSYSHPFFGKSDELLLNGDTMLYLVNPIYNTQSIHPDKVYGYHLMTVKADTLLREFDQNNTDYKLLIKQNDNVLISSASDKQVLGKTDDLRSEQTLSSYNLTIVGISQKAALQSKLNSINTRISIILGVSLIVCFLMIHTIQRLIVGRLKLMSQHFKQVQRNPFTIHIPVQGDDEISDLMLRYNRMTTELQNHINQVYVSEIHKKNAEFIALKMQIQPHFLYNTLESLRMQAIINDQSALAEQLFQLGKLYHWMLQPSDDLITVHEELEHTKSYLNLLMLGKSNRVEIHVATDLNLYKCNMLKFTLQPIVENAIQHGKLEQIEHPIISIHIRSNSDKLIMEITNNGDNLTSNDYENIAAMLNGPYAFPDRHLGLKNIHERIKLYFGEGHGLRLVASDTSSVPFRLLMILPYKS
ncbi:sensor histidine kinase [Cohnella terricola]|uniref:HAMP domain-containing protein n=1 Tax=Cohnella terricola TaxID=1289167 RepID=A0A559JWK2_9BACL|nr:histidine kinase [Cohnella terricola]TVY04268.1 HAMP domain-containing protein [Cohnella terricola]